MATKNVLRDVSLDDKYRLNKTKAYLTGIEALVRLPMLQHQRDQQKGLNTAGFCIRLSWLTLGRCRSSYVEGRTVFTRAQYQVCAGRE